MATKPHAFRIGSDALPVAAAQDLFATNAHGTSTARAHHHLSVQPLRACLGAFEVDLRTGELHAGAGTVRLQEQPFQILRMLLARDGDMVTRDEIQETLWPDGTIVDFGHSINAAIKKLRRALGDSADHPHYIDTVARRGYRLMVPVQWMHHGPAARASAEEVRNGSPSPQSISPLADHRIARHRPLQVLDGGTLGAAAGSPRASGQARQMQQRQGQSCVAMVQRRDLEDHLLSLEKLVLARIRRLRHRQRCLYRLQTPPDR